MIRSRYRARIVIADDHKLIADGCKNLLEPEFEVVAVVHDGRTLVQAAEELKPDAVILDISMPELNGLDAGEQVKRKSRSIKLIYLTVALGPDVAAEAFRRGASAYVLKQGYAEELFIALRRVLRGDSYLSSLITRETRWIMSTCRKGARAARRNHVRSPGGVPQSALIVRSSGEARC